MHARAVERANEELRRRKRAIADAAALAAAAGIGAIVLSPSSSTLAVAVAAGAGVEAALALIRLVSRRDLVARLALEPAAYALPEVRRYGLPLTRERERARLAAWLSEVLRDAHLPGTLYLADRVGPAAREIEALARELVSPALSVQPASAVSCRRLLTRTVESPLYNPNLPFDELLLELRRIRRGISPA